MENIVESDGEFSIDQELTPIKSRKLVTIDSGEDEDTLEKLKREHKKKEKDKRMKDKKKKIILVESESDDSEVESDEELVLLKKELEEVNKKKREQKMKEKKDKIRKEIENGKKELKKKTEKEKGDNKVNQSIIVSKNKSNTSKDGSLVNIKDLRKNSSIKSKAESVVKKILDLDSDDSSSDTDTVDSSSDSDSVVNKRSKKYKSKNKKKSGIFDHPSDEVIKKQMWPQSRLQFEYACSKINFDELEFNLFVAGELEILSSAKLCEVERIGRTKLLKKIAYYTELYEWTGLKKMYANIIRQIENGLANWSKDFSEIETPILIKYVKTEVKNKRSIQFGENKKISKKEESVFYCSHFQRKKCTHTNSHYGKIKGVDRFLQHICATCWREDNKKSFHPECSENCPFQGK